jgi:hypothetical protein
VPGPAPEPAAEPLRLAVLGQVRAAGPDGALLPVTGLGANLLLALALEPRGLSTARAVDETWPDGAPASGRAALQTLVSRLRGAHPGLLVSTAAGYALGADRDGVDLLRAADALGSARAALGGLVLRDPCAEALEDREPWPCVGVSASSEEAWNPGSESRTGPLDLRVSPDFRHLIVKISHGNY